MRILGVDLGTTHVKAALFEMRDDAPPLVVGLGREGLRLEVPKPGRAEQDADAVLAATRRAMETALRGEKGVVAAFSGAMHSLLALDREGRPLGPALTWADQRSVEEAAELRSTDAAARTGTPVHPMSPLCKLLWMKRHGGFSAVHRVTGLKEYVVARLAGVECDFMDRSMASATGLLDGRSGHWASDLVERVGVGVDRLPRIIEPTDAVAPGFVAGAADGPCANLGSGAIDGGHAALTVGTSGALRLCVRGFSPDPRGRTFCYFLADDLWVRGGAISNGGILLDWACRAYGFADVPSLLAAAAEVGPGADGLVMLGALTGERSPHWDARARGVIHGLRLDHGRAHLARAAVEATAYAIREIVGDLPSIRVASATGGFAASPFWLQLMADVTGLPLQVPKDEISEVAALGAALLGGRAAGLAPIRPIHADRQSVLPTPHPGYEAAFAIYRRLYPATRVLERPIP
jgi:gluconokinase